jgi:hypothetical protein
MLPPCAAGAKGGALDPRGTRVISRIGHLGMGLLRLTWYALMLLAVLALRNNDAPPFIYVAF